MTFIKTLAWEWKHYMRSNYKLMAIALFMIAAVVGLINGIQLKKRLDKTLNLVQHTAIEQQEKALSLLKEGKKSPEDMSWIDLGTPQGAMSFADLYATKAPTQLMPLAVGQTRQHGFYKKMGSYSTAYDSDMSAEISNPEEVAGSTLDFTFVLLFLLPLLLIVLLYPLGATERDADMVRLLTIQSGNYKKWLIQRLLANGIYMTLFLLVLLGISGIWTGSFSELIFWKYVLVILAYTWIWTIVLGAIIFMGMDQTSQAVAMILVWAILAIFLPGAFQQLANAQTEANLMVDFLDAKRVDQGEIYEEEFSKVKREVLSGIPELSNTQLASLPDSLLSRSAKNDVYRTAVAMHMKEVFANNEAYFEQKNRIIRSNYWLNPLVAVQNYLYQLAGTDYYAFHDFRNQVQSTNFEICRRLLLDNWDQVQIDEKGFTDYLKLVQD